MQEMKILMIGNQNSGKTTYMASSYGLMRQGKFGFYIRADEETDEGLYRLFEKVKSGGYPMPDDKRKSFAFDLYYYQQPLLSFEWLDYYGGVINESKSEQLLQDLDGADAVMLFVEAEALLRNDRKTTQLRRILYLIGAKLMHTESFFNVIVVLTKYDQVGAAASFGEVCAQLSQFSESIAGKQNVYFRIVPVSCTASGFANVDLPLMDILHSGVGLKCLGYAAAAKEQYDKAVEYNSRRGILDWTVSKVLGLRTNGEIADEAAKKCGEQAALYEQIKAPFEMLDQYRDHYEIVIPQPVQMQNLVAGRGRRSRFGVL